MVLQSMISRRWSTLPRSWPIAWPYAKNAAMRPVVSRIRPIAAGGQYSDERTSTVLTGGSRIGKLYKGAVVRVTAVWRWRDYNLKVLF